MRRVLFVSKPIAPPFHDGAKCLVRDIATHLKRSRATVLSTAGVPPLIGPVDVEPVYPNAGSFAPALQDNARVMQRLLLGRRADLWHFVFAPNPLSSTAGRIAKTIRRVPVVQTVASAPRSFSEVGRLLFGDRIVVVSAWTHDKLVSAGADATRLRVIAPSVEVPKVTPEQHARVRESLGLPDGAPLVTYPGDVETSSGAGLVAAAIPAVLERAPDTRFVFACRKKTRRAEEAEERIRRDLSRFRERVQFVGELESLPPLLAISTLVLFPVDTLYGKVDLPIALLECMALGVPIVALDEGPLPELGAAVLVGRSAEGLADETAHLLADEARRREMAEQGRALVASRHDPNIAAQAYEAVYDELGS
jgi:phosphatidylinositol alpha-1,6-mannosyltransferase